MKNPLSSQYSEEQNRELVQSALDGDKQALEQLIHLHQPFVYNVAWKMVHDPNDAADLTQETLIKVITKLSQFKFNSSFRTWLYRIVVNEFLQTKRRKREEFFVSFEDHGEKLDSVPSEELNLEEEQEFDQLSREMQMRCMSGMIMCLNREQRLIYIIGDTFGVNHSLGAEIFGLSKQNFRVKLHRARKDLYNYMNNKCGLVNKDNPCRCPKKAKALIKMGALQKENMEFNVDYTTRISDYVEGNYIDVAEQVNELYTQLFRDHKTKDNFNKDTLVTEILENEDLMKHFQ